jgi:hypothetical protein
MKSFDVEVVIKGVVLLTQIIISKASSFSEGCSKLQLKFEQ